MFDFEGTVNKTVMDVFSRDVTYMPRVSVPGGRPFPIKAIFDRNHEVILTDIRTSEEEGHGHSTMMPVLTVRLADFEAEPRQDDEAIVGSETFRVYDVQPDGEGMADLVLKKKR